MPNASRPRTDEALFAAYAAGDPAAFAELVTRWTPALRSVFRRTLPDAEIDEAVQDVFLQLHRSAADFRRGARLRPWVLTIAHNLRRDRARRAWRRRDPLVADAAHSHQPATIEVEQDRQRVQAALDTLPPSQRDVIVLHWFNDLSFPEIAATLGGSAGAVKVRAYRGYERLRALLADDGVPAMAGRPA